MKTNIPRIMIVGTGSGSGKTTVICGVLKALQNRGLKVASFKCGPDYIDPMFHSKVLGEKSKNLDIFMCGEETTKYLLAKNSKGYDISVIEGVMGIYDGIGKEDKFSSNHLATLTNTNEILVINTKGMSLTIVAQIFGYLNFRKNNIKGIILNNTTEMMYCFLKEMIEKELNIKVYGYVPKIKDIVFHSRHLGLITPNEIDDIQQKINKIATICEKTIDLDEIIAVANDNMDFDYTEIKIENICNDKKVEIAVAMDKSFCFYYEDNFTLLKELGANLHFFSPMYDTKLPENIQGIIFGGGYPEEYASVLSQNKTMMCSIKNAIYSGMPVIAECGGFMYLSKTIKDKNNAINKMVNITNTEVKMTNKLSKFGYIKITANKDNLLCKKDESINAHEFHYSNSDNDGSDFTAKKNNGTTWQCIFADETMFLGYPHLHLWGNIEFAKNFVKKCLELYE